jgi:hypothetical protein
MAFDNDNMAKCPAFILNTGNKSIFLTQIIARQGENRDSFKIADSFFKIINKGER